MSACKGRPSLNTSTPGAAERQPRGEHNPGPGPVHALGSRREAALSYADHMEARKINVWRSRYSVTDRGREITVWDSSVWKRGGDFELDGRRLQVRSNAWGKKYRMVDDVGGY